MLKSPKENQPDLFGDDELGIADESTRVDSVRSFFRSKNPLYSVSLEQIFITLIVLVILFVMVFMMGVLRGKSIHNKNGATVVRTFEPTSRPGLPVVQSGNTVTARPVPTAGVPSRNPATPTQTAVLTPKSSALQPFANNPAKPYTIQVVTYRSEDRALKEVSQLQAKGYQPKMITKNGYSVVCVGQYANRGEADKDLRSLRSRYKDCYLRKI